MSSCLKLGRSATRSLFKMKIVQFKANDNKVRIGLLRDDKVVDVNASDNSIPHSLVEFLYEENASERMQRIFENPKQEYHLKNIQLLSPIIKPDKILGLASNYKDDCNMRKVPHPKEPVVFSKFSSIITGPYDPITKPASSNAVDWEVEIVAVIGKKAHQVKAEDALDYVFGYTITQDLTAKDWVMRNGGQLVMCKNFEGFCPLGPCIVTKDELGDVYNLSLKTWVNGVLKQDGHSDNMLHRVDKTIEYLSSVMTLLPGDLICTGTPYGVGASQIPPQYLKKGDLLESEVEKIGRMANRIV
ncbi:oxaloacetate tautomerase fahd2, mitochondrial-like [Leptinotarsa decemlineata]|uniref:oxaloacetate tautomerase fahd2, mitochondrial-like n=1 Tax=Leptinotarsa decemlineata TaxID=7539 RepID=UPI003D30AA5C